MTSSSVGADGKSCEFFVEDAEFSRRYVVKLKPQDIDRVKCRTIRRHLAQSIGFPYLPHEFDLFPGHPSLHSTPLADDDASRSFNLRHGTVLYLLRRGARGVDRAPQTSSSMSPKLAEVVTSTDHNDVDDEDLMSGLSQRQRKLQSQLLQEFRRSSSQDHQGASPEPIPLQRCAVDVHRNSADAELQPSRTTTARNSRSTSLSEGNYDATVGTGGASAARRHSASMPSSRYEESPHQQNESDTPSSAGHPELMGTTIESLPRPTNANNSGFQRGDSSSAAAECIPKRITYEDVDTAAVHRADVGEGQGSIVDALQSDVEGLLLRVASLTSSNSAAQRELHELRDALEHTEKRLEEQTGRSEALHKEAVAELKHHLGIKFVRSQADFDAIVRNFSRHKEDEIKINRIAQSQRELMELLAIEQSKRRQLQLQMEDLKGNIRVVIRIRPALVDGVPHHASHIVAPTDASLHVDSAKGVLRVVSSTSGTKAFEFYRVLTDQSSQEDVFQEVGPLVHCAVDGVNVSVFAYGQTGSGKTHTILGSADHVMRHASTTHRNESAFARTFVEQQGLIPRSMAELFRLIEERVDVESCITCSLVELYNEQLFDLLATTPSSGEKLDAKSVHTLAASRHQVRSAEDAVALLLVGSSSRQVQATRVNAQSSRSHLVFSVHVALRAANGSGQVQESKMSFVDLAGSERVANTQSVGGRLKEAQFINKSLSALGDVVAALSEGESAKERFVPYRNSKLTMLLQDCIGGNSKTMLVACIAPYEQTTSAHATCSENGGVTERLPRVTNVHETLSTLQFASRVRLIRNTCRVNSAATQSTPSAAREVYRDPNELVDSLKRAPREATKPLRASQALNQLRSSSKTPRRPPPMKY